MNNSKSYLLISLLSASLPVLFMASSQTGRHPYLFPELEAFPPMPRNSENPVSIEGAELGRMLFYDPITSRDSSMSCASCHQQKFAFSGGEIRFNMGIDSQFQKRNTMPLFNLAWYQAYFWDGREESLETQVLVPIRMHSELDLPIPKLMERLNRHPKYPRLFQLVFGSEKIDSVLIAYAIAQFERTLISHNSRMDSAIRFQIHLNRTELAGMEIINDQTKGNCLHCHTTDSDLLGTRGGFSNNGLDLVSSDLGLEAVSGDSNQRGWFRIPSLRNLSFTAPYMHDGRFQTLEEVLDFYDSGVQQHPTIDPLMSHHARMGSKLTENEKIQIIAFLKCLDDYHFINSGEFSNPFE